MREKKPKQTHRKTRKIGQIITVYLNLNSSVITLEVNGAPGWLSW